MTSIDDGMPGAYGLRMAGLESLRPQLVLAPRQWPLITIDRSGPYEPAPETRFDLDSATRSALDDSSTVTMHGVRIEREPLRAQFCGAGSRDDVTTIHPGLAVVGAVAGRWLGRDVFHAGAFHRDGGAWVVLGAKEAGKSSLLGLLASQGVDVMTDDVLVVEDGQALAGPRCIDLREGAAEWLGRGEDIGLVGDRRRWRMAVHAAPTSAPLRGWIMPTWGADIELRPVPPRLRLPLLYANLAIHRAPRHPRRFLELGALPFLEFRRPRSWAAAGKASDALIEVVDAQPR